MDDSTEPKESSLELNLSDKSTPSNPKVRNFTLHSVHPWRRLTFVGLYQSEDDADGSSSEWAPESVVSSESLDVVVRPRGQQDLSDIEDSSMSISDDDNILDNNDEHCSKCKSNVNPETLLCCDGCPRVYHMGCLEPKLTRIPTGRWYCPECTAALSLGDVDKVLVARTNKDSVEEYYVKWKEKSYRHCSWVPKSQFLAAKKFFVGLHSKLRAFENRDQNEIDLEGYNPHDYVNGVHKNWLKVDRILESRGLHHGFYYVKWKDLGYDQCTWESANEIKEDSEDKIKEFHKQVSIRQEVRRRLGIKHLKQMSMEPTSTENPEEMFESTPSFISGGSLHPYQLEGLNWLKFKWHQEENIILADEMGLGKTIQTIAFLAYLWTRGVVNPHLVVVPLSTMQNWVREFEIWAPQLKVTALMGNKDCRDIILKHEIYLAKNLKPNKTRVNSRDNMNRRVKCHVLLTSYELVSVESSRLGKLDFECMIVDEGHRLKGKSSKLVKDLNNLSSQHRLLLTGTPLQNNIQELFALLHFIDARKFDSWESFEADFADISQEDQVSKLHGLLLPHLLRRLKKDVLQSLPPKKEQIVRVEMSDMQRSMYKSILASNYEILTTEKKNEEVRRGLRFIMVDLRKCCMHPFLFDGIEQPYKDKKEELQAIINSSGKLELLDKMLEKLIERGHRILIYSQYVIMLNILEDYLVLKQVGHLRIDGSINGGERQTLIDRYNKEPEKYSVFLLSTRAGGLGINLATADTVVLYDSDYNPHNDIQAQARAHRLGQKNPVMIYRLITRLTIEERMMQLAKEKLVLEQIVVRKLGHRELKQDELDGIIKYGAAELFADERLIEGQVHEKGLLGGGRVTDQEREKVKLASGTSKIMYDAEALEKLLDRSNMETEEQDKMEVENGELMAGFKIANFDIVQRSQTKDVSWEELLKSRVNAMKSSMTKDRDKSSGGRRRRKAEMNYHIDDDLSNASPDSDFDAAEHAEEEDDETSSSNFDADSTAENQAKAPGLTPKPLKRKEQSDPPLVTSHVKKRPVHETRPPPPPAEPCITWRGTELLVLGLGKKERMLFLKLLLRFGFPSDDHGSWEEFKSRLPRKKHQAFDDYAKMLIAAASGAPVIEGATKEDFIFDCKPEELMTRVGMIHLFKERLRTVQGRQGKLLMSPETSKHLYPNGIWRDHHDQVLLRNLLKYGYGRWKDILCNGNENLEEVLCKELKIELPKTPAVNEVIEIDLSTSSEGEPGDLEQKSKRKKSEKQKESVKTNPPTEDPASIKAKIRSAEAKCRNWVAIRLKDLAAAFNADQVQALNQQNDTSQFHKLSDECPAKKLHHTYQNMINQCASVRDNSSMVYETRTYSEILAAGAKFRDQLSELETMAQEIIKNLPDTHDEFLGKSADSHAKEQDSNSPTASDSQKAEGSQ
eukprot:g4582.t1